MNIMYDFQDILGILTGERACRDRQRAKLNAETFVTLLENVNNVKKNPHKSSKNIFLVISYHKAYCTHMLL